MDDDSAVTAAAVSPMKGETFLTHWRDIADAKEEASNAGTLVARSKKAAKRDGVDLDVLSVLERLAKLDADARKIFMAKLETYSQWIDLPLGAFGMGLPVPEVRASAKDDYHVWQAGQDGFRAGTGGSERSANPYKPGSLMHPAWDKRWSAGFKAHQKKLAGALVRGTGGARTKADPEMPRPGAPPRGKANGTEAATAH